MSEQYYYGHGKLLLTSEYFVLDGAKSIALPTVLGQRMHVKHRPSNNPKLYWKSFDTKGECWFETSFELWHFNTINEEDSDKDQVKVLQQILRQARKQNIHFLRDEVDTYIETVLEFPLAWGLGSSSTLIYNIAQWAYVSPFELQSKTFKGSGYDIACAQSLGPITYQLQSRGPHWETILFNPVFKENIYFVYLNQKQNSRDGIARYKDLVTDNREELVKKLNQITDDILSCIDLKEFENLIYEHESIISMAMDLPRVKDVHFNDYWGAVKSLGAWGGDFVMVTSDHDETSTREYFASKGHETFFTFNDLILQNFQKLGGLLPQVESEANYVTTKQ